MLPLLYVACIQVFAVNTYDLTVDADRLLSSMGTNKLNGRTVVQFSANVLNVGTGPFVTTANAQIFNFSLLNATDELPIAGVNASNPVFCIEDSYCNEITNSPFDCSEQGISTTCAAECTSRKDCQWIDITDLPLGPYILQAVAVDAENDANPENNIVLIPFDTSTLPSFVAPIGLVVAVIIGGVCLCLLVCACCAKYDKGTGGHIVGIMTTKGSMQVQNRRKYMPGQLRPDDINW